MPSNQAHAYFALSGYNFNPDLVTQILGIEPTSVNNAGMHTSIDKPVISSWELATDKVTAGVDVYALTEELIKQLLPCKKKILELTKSHNLSPRLVVVLTLSVDKDQSCPDVGLGSRNIRFLADIGAFLNIDYKLSDRI